MQEWLNNPRVIGINGGVLSGLLVAAISRYLLSKRENSQCRCHPRMKALPDSFSILRTNKEWRSIMVTRTRYIGSLSLALLNLILIQGCTPSAQKELDDNLKKAIVMKYVHVANVKGFQAEAGTLVGVTHGSFWAIFEVCTLDIQGSALTGFSYDASKFFIDGGSANYGAGNPGNVIVASDVRSSQSYQVLDAAHNAFSLSPTTQFFSKQFYPNLKYRIAIFVKENPAGYTGDAMALKYDGQPQVAALVQDVSPRNPSFRDFYNPGASPAIVAACP